MAEGLGVSGEVVVSEEAVESGEMRVTLEFTPARVTAYLDRSQRLRLFKTSSLSPTISGNEIVIPLSRIRCRAGDKVCWQAYEA